MGPIICAKLFLADKANLLSGDFMNSPLFMIKIKVKPFIHFLLVVCVFLSTNVYAIDLSELKQCAKEAKELFDGFSLSLTKNEQAEICMCVKNKNPDLLQTKKDWDTLGPQSLTLILLECSEAKMYISSRKNNINYYQELAKLKNYDDQDIERIRKCNFKALYKFMRNTIINNGAMDWPVYNRERSSCE
jgi:hypothetical protein